MFSFILIGNEEINPIDNFPVQENVYMATKESRSV